MESTIFHRNHENPTFLPSPNSHSSNSSTSSSGNGLQQQQQQQQQQPTPPPTPPSFPRQATKPITRSESANPYLTTFVQADTSSFKQVVQMLTGSSETATPMQPTHSKPTQPTANTNKIQIRCYCRDAMAIPGHGVVAMGF